MASVIPKKFNRHVLKGVAFHSNEEKGFCTLQDVVAYVYLKNSRILPVDRVEAIAKEILPRLCRSQLVRKTGDRYRLNELLLSERGGAQRHALEEAAEDAAAGPSGTRRAKRRPSSPATANKGKKNIRKSRGGQMMDSEEGAISHENAAEAEVDEDDDRDEEEEHASENEEADEQPEFSHRPIKEEIVSRTSLEPDQDMPEQTSPDQAIPEQVTPDEEDGRTPSSWFSWFLW